MFLPETGYLDAHFFFYFFQLEFSKTHVHFCIFLKLSQKGSFPGDGQALTPASVNSLDTSSQQPHLDTSSTNLDLRIEVKQQDEEEESEAGSCSKGGKLNSLKTEEKPMKSELKKDECSREGGKGVPMDTSTTPIVGVKTEDRKIQVKQEVKEEEETSEAVAPQAPPKKKSMNSFLILIIVMEFLNVFRIPS